MSVVKQWLCDHQFEPMALYREERQFVKKCRKCGRRIEEELTGDSARTV